MKRILLTLSVVACCNAVHAQKKHSIAFGFDYVNDLPSRSFAATEGSGSYRYKVAGTFLERSAAWVAWYYDNRYSLRLYAHAFRQEAIANMDAYRVTGIRTLFLADYTFGYNFLKNPKSKLAAWGYAGVSIPLSESWEHTFADPYVIYEGSVSKRSIDGIYPCAQAVLKYQLTPWFFVGAGGTYRYIFKDFQPVSANLSLGFQL